VCHELCYGVSDRCHTEQQSGWVRSADGPRYSALEWGLALLGLRFHMHILKHSLRQSEETDPVLTFKHRASCI
jgi:hypothetical protein